ncbi:glycosyltransferase family protein [Vibrio panuliri]|uniref:Glycosyl transferase n=1 Tax=Vibrio panuliri TaxID=1381081 RepID=A0ABX3FF73_9VIBR|nr:glycosyltransferase family 1 protein [Vibrio panuliri]KAB1454323.1 glycosyltransferase family 1 protein [Vibrio panuliri]OLQ89292.1 glycosyl transferase [Vibrio panuliri]
MRDMIVFGEDFGGLPSSTQHLIKHLPNMGKIIWVNSIGLRQPRFNKHDCARVFSKLFPTVANSQTKQASPKHIKVVNLRTIPAPSSKLSRKLARNMMLQQLEPILRQHNIERPILWASLPTVADLCGHLGEQSVVYYCGDDFSALAGVDHDTVKQHELKLVDKANVVFAASSKIADMFPRCKTLLLPHGVDVELFTTPTKRADDLPNRGRPIAGFYGSLSNWLDYQLIETVARQMIHWDFVFIGPNELEYNPLPQLDNVFYLGPKPHHMLASYSQHWQASLLPFQSNRQIEACNPLKLREYLAAGTPVIATPFPALAPYSRYIHITADAGQLCSTLNNLSLKQRLPTGIVSGESWQSRSEWVRHIMELL